METIILCLVLLIAERRKRWSDSYKGVSDDEDENDAKEKEAEDAKLKVDITPHVSDKIFCL